MDTYSEFRIAVEGIGYAVGYNEPPFIGRIIDDPDRADVYTDADRCHTIYGTILDDYRRLGQPCMADRIRVYARTVTLTREPWHAPEAVDASGPALLPRP